MARKTLEVDINPAVLKWARESAGLEIKDVAKRIRTSAETVAKWESGERKPTLRALEELAIFLKRPLAAFFLPEPPSEPPMPKDFRVLPSQESLPLSKATRLALREARRLQGVAAELVSEMGLEPIAQIERTSLQADPEEAAAKERERLGVDIEEQFDWTSSHMAFREWRRAIEDLNVLTFQMRMPLSEARGFSLADGGPPVIVVNSVDSINARIFTLFHEYAHLLLGTAGVCLPEVNPEANEQSVERFCNHFCGALLVPKETLLEDEEIRFLSHSSAISDIQLERIAARYRVSKQVIWRRMRIIGLISPTRYQTKLKTWEEEESRKPLRKKPSFGVHPARRSVLQRGPFFTSLVLEARDRDLITHSDVSDYLSIQVKHLDKVRSFVQERGVNA
jgi:Zn-dependent peptidase ImmA (M78 family)/DNA-binding XRE family transcriptional regulator